MFLLPPEERRVVEGLLQALAGTAGMLDATRELSNLQAPIGKVMKATADTLQEAINEALPEWEEVLQAWYELKAEEVEP